jgi:hypothetical protein
MKASFVPGRLIVNKIKARRFTLAHLCAPALPRWRGPSLRQARLPCLPKRQVGHAFFHFARVTVCPLAFFPNLVDLVVVAAHIEGRVDNREEQNRDYRDADRPHARLLSRKGA